jgi:hypothetical protein
MAPRLYAFSADTFNDPCFQQQLDDVLTTCAELVHEYEHGSATVGMLGGVCRYIGPLLSQLSALSQGGGGVRVYSVIEIDEAHES